MAGAVKDRKSHGNWRVILTLTVTVQCLEAEERLDQSCYNPAVSSTHSSGQQSPPGATGSLAASRVPDAFIISWDENFSRFQLDFVDQGASSTCLGIQ